MSLRYIIDGYNVIHHPLFRRLPKGSCQGGSGLLHLIQHNRLCGKSSNKAIVVFDGYKDLSKEPSFPGIEVVFSFGESADEKIRKMLEASPGSKDIIVVSDDREVVFFARHLGARPMGCDEFLAPKERSKPKGKAQDEEAKLNYSAMHKINQELKKIWLK